MVLIRQSVEICPPRGAVGPVHPQSPGIPRRRHRPMDRPHRGQPANPLLRTVGDRKHHGRGMAQEVKLRVSRREGCRRSGQAGLGAETSRHAHRDQHHAALTVVPGEAQSGGRFSLSHDADLSDADLTKLLLSSPECQLPSNFRIAPLPNETASWIVSQARTLPVRKQLQRPLPRSTLSRGAAGLSSCSSSGPGTTSSSTRCHPETEQSFSAPLPTPSDRPAFRGQSFRDWLRRQSETPSSHVHARPSGTTSAGTQGKTTSASLHSFYSGSSEDAASPTRPSGRRRRSPAGSSERSPPSGKRKRTVQSGN